jgi:hypothetical protein
MINTERVDETISGFHIFVKVVQAYELVTIDATVRRAPNAAKKLSHAASRLNGKVHSLVEHVSNFV